MALWYVGNCILTTTPVHASPHASPHATNHAALCPSCAPQHSTSQFIMLGAQTALFYWKKRDKKSYDLVRETGAGGRARVHILGTRPCHAHVCTWAHDMSRVTTCQHKLTCAVGKACMHARKPCLKCHVHVLMHVCAAGDTLGTLDDPSNR